MNLSTKGRYAVMAMVDLARNGQDRPVALNEIAQRQEISLSYLEQLFAGLRRGGLVVSARGPGGGYRLAHSPENTRISDIMIAVDDARFCDPHVKMGYVAGDGGAIIWPQLIGFAKAKEYLLTGDMLDAKEAERIGLINYAVPRDQLDAKVDAFADRLVNGASKAIKWTKTSINMPLRQLAHSMLDASLAYEALTNMGRDHQEAVTAFQEKRKPRFEGR